MICVAFENDKTYSTMPVGDNLHNMSIYMQMPGDKLDDHFICRNSIALSSVSCCQVYIAGGIARITDLPPISKVIRPQLVEE
jgi:hypothetical protein